MTVDVLENPHKGSILAYYWNSSVLGISGMLPSLFHNEVSNTAAATAVFITASKFVSNSESTY
jgi:hypothetical protein